jgi:serine/threonine-protein kinase HipA
MSTQVYVFADWDQLSDPVLVGSLRSSMVKNKEHFRFAYDNNWLRSAAAQKIDPSLEFYAGEQHGSGEQNFGAFLDSCPDRWGRLLMKRREAAIARQEDRKPRVLNEVDYLLGVHDLYRMGALRFKRELDGAFLDDNDAMAAPPISSLRDLEYAITQIEELHVEDDKSDVDNLKWLMMLIAPGSSLGGARPKSCVVDEQNNLWIAKFPSRYDDHDIAAWEYVTYQLALKSGIEMAECRLEKFNSHHHTFLTKRFDRVGDNRLHFSSAMTQLGFKDGQQGASYLDLAQFLTEQGSKTKSDLEQLWRRIVFSIAVSNTDDHLRNHGFIFRDGGWELSPAYDINPTTPANGLHLFISEDDNSLSYDLAMDVIDFFRLNKPQAQSILDQVRASVATWKEVATQIGISRNEQTRMQPAFNL